MDELKDTIEKYFEFEKDPYKYYNIDHLRPSFVLKYSNSPISNSAKFYIDLATLMDDVNLYKPMFGKYSLALIVWIDIIIQECVVTRSKKPSMIRMTVENSHIKKINQFFLKPLSVDKDKNNHESSSRDRSITKFVSYGIKKMLLK